jgi:hypothetical protein
MANPTLFRRRLNRKEACAFLRERLGCGVSVSTIRRWPIAYVRVGRDASYAEDDLETFARQFLSAAPQRMAVP